MTEAGRKRKKSKQPRDESNGNGTWPPATTLGHRVRRERLRQGLSVRELAERAGINKETVVHLEKGHTPTCRTLVRVCDPLGVSVVHLLRPEADEEDDQLVAVHSRRTEERIPRSRVEIDPNSRETVRLRPAGSREIVAADEKVLLSWLACRLPGGKLNAWLLELHAPTDPSTHAGEEFVFCLRGRARLTVAGRSYVLEEGDAATFWCAEEHNYAPAGGERSPVLLLSVWVSARDLNG
jgi:transcriptional regulator with XRE-family HTH domain